MTEQKFQLAGQTGRLDKVLVTLMPQESRATIQKLIRDQQVRVNQVVEKANFKLKGQEVITVQVSLESTDREELPEAEYIPLSIVYEDDCLLVLNKPAGLVVHPSKGHVRGTLVNGLLYYLKGQLSDGSDAYRPGIVHRIDKDTSGLLVIAKTNHAHQALSQQLETHQMRRKYQALVHGQVKAEQGSIEVPLQRDPANRLRWSAQPNGKYALTHFRRLARFDNASLLELELETGRTHQIRVHLEYIGHPIVGDPVYRKGLDHIKGALVHNKTGQRLHAYAITFRHPQSGETMTFEVPLPENFQQTLDQLSH